MRILIKIHYNLYKKTPVKCDVLVAGGGPAGIAAAIAATSGVAAFAATGARIFAAAAAFVAALAAISTPGAAAPQATITGSTTRAATQITDR